MIWQRLRAFLFGTTPGLIIWSGALILVGVLVGSLANGGPATTPQALATLAPYPTYTPLPTYTPFPTCTPRIRVVRVTPEMTPVPPTGTITADTLNVRSGPGTTYPKIGRLKAGDEVTLIARNEAGDWLQTDVGWVAAEWVETPVDVAALPVAEHIAAPPPTATPTPTPVPPTPTPLPPTAEAAGTPAGEG